jgi:hypothetical protein
MHRQWHNMMHWHNILCQCMSKTALTDPMPMPQSLSSARDFQRDQIGPYHRHCKIYRICSEFFLRTVALRCGGESLLITADMFIIRRMNSGAASINYRII